MTKPRKQLSAIEDTPYDVRYIALPAPRFPLMVPVQYFGLTFLSNVFQVSAAFKQNTMFSRSYVD